MRELSARRVVVLHNLSCIEDPTRIFRALRYEARYGLRMDAHTYNLALACSQMDLVGDLSSARLRDELVLLLREPRVDHAVQRMQELGVSRAVHPRLTTGATTRGLVRSAENLWRRYGLAAEAPLWRLRLVWLLRNLSPEEIVVWAQRMTFRREDAAVLERAMVVGRRIGQRLAGGMSEPDLREAAAGEPAEALVVAMVLDEGGAVERRVAHYLAVTRSVRLEVGGRDLVAIGFESGPRLGGVLHSLLRMKIGGLLPGRDDELEAARRLL
jgi:tRNA nucleotidyltransferase (CCA-adding enzyme)